MLLLRLFRFAGCFFFLFGSTTSLGKSEESVLAIWSRGVGDHTGGNEISRVKPSKIDVTKLKLKEHQSYDLQYDREGTYRGVKLSHLLAQSKPLPGEDLALLHFANGMVIPIPLNDGGASLRRMDPFVAFAIKSGKGFNAKFPRLSKEDENWNDPRPIVFGANKIVVAKGWHPFVSDSETSPVQTKKGDTKATPSFSPWRHADSLVGIEYVNEKGYYAQFHAQPKMDLDMGFQVWKKRCQFCHGADQVGASLGWDILKPVPLYKLKQPEHMYNMVKYPYHDAIMRGLLMPQQTDVKKGEMYILWGWMKGLDRSGVRPYRKN